MPSEVLLAIFARQPCAALTAGIPVLGTKHAMVQEDVQGMVIASVMENPLEFGARSAQQANTLKQQD